jgi:nucleoside-diphosphate-sugar epimerase
MKVLVAGAYRFAGRRLCPTLAHDGHHVVAPPAALTATPEPATSCRPSCAAASSKAARDGRRPGVRHPGGIITGHGRISWELTRQLVGHLAS